MKQKLKFSFYKYLIRILIFIFITNLILFVVASIYININLDSKIDFSSISFMYTVLVITFALIHSLDLRKRYIEIIDASSKYKICYHYFQSEADSSLFSFDATKKNVYFDYADKIKNGFFFITFYGISEKRNLHIPKVFDDMNILIEIINKNKSIKK